MCLLVFVCVWSYVLCWSFGCLCVSVVAWLFDSYVYIGGVAWVCVCLLACLCVCVFVCSCVCSLVSACCCAGALLDWLLCRGVGVVFVCAVDSGFACLRAYMLVWLIVICLVMCVLLIVSVCAVLLV